MKRCLSLSIKNYFESECWSYFRFAIIDAYKNLYKWKFHNYNYLYGDEKGNIFWGRHGEIYYPINCYNEILKTSGFLHQEISSDTIIDFIKERINQEEYIMIECEYSYLISKILAGYVHEVLIYGYDDEEKVFYTPIIENDNWIEKRFSFEEIKEAYSLLDNANQNEHVSSSLSFKRNYLLPITILKPIKEFVFHNNIYIFQHYISNLCIKSLTKRNNEYFYNGYIEYYKCLICGGKNILNSMDPYYKNEYNYSINIKKIIGFKNILSEYIDLIADDYFNEELKQFNSHNKEKILEYLNICCNLSLKHKFRKNNNYIKKIIELLETIIPIEEKFLETINDYIEMYTNNHY